MDALSSKKLSPFAYSNPFIRNEFMPSAYTTFRVMMAHIMKKILNMASNTVTLFIKEDHSQLQKKL